MNISLCIAWFIFGMLVGILLIISIAILHEERRIENGKEQSNNNHNQNQQ